MAIVTIGDRVLMNSGSGLFVRHKDGADDRKTMRPAVKSSPNEKLPDRDHPDFKAKWRALLYL
ncbi:hypothetical protein [Pelagibius sp. Alg239-R121]|uniref:hypothetical protein n=1 Tax=Pelagibius sp. Alg239-R121 TaxID=2993448 RepID=UPI0024A63FF9|nr:hypothetical protein [Pelagibius sp. Alg239-R121]